MKVTVILVDDHPVVRKGFRYMLGSPEVEIVGEASTFEDAMALVQESSPMIALMDIKLASTGLSGIDATREIRKKHPQTSVIIVSGFDDEENVREAVAAGASGYLLKDVTKEDLLQAIKIVAGGGTVTSPIIGKKLFKEFASLASKALPKEVAEYHLSEKELEVLKLMVQGHSNKEIASSLYVTEKTVKAHVSAVLKKLQVKDRTQAVIHALRKGIVR